MSKRRQLIDPLPRPAPRDRVETFEKRDLEYFLRDLEIDEMEPEPDA